MAKKTRILSWSQIPDPSVPGKNGTSFFLAVVVLDVDVFVFVVAAVDVVNIHLVVAVVAVVAVVVVVAVVAGVAVVIVVAVVTSMLLSLLPSSSLLPLMLLSLDDE